MDIKTRFLILSDTHAEDWAPRLASLPPIDVAIHCGDLTEESKMAEFRTSLQLLNSIDAPLKLVIAGNHDFTLDTPKFQQKLAETNASIEPELIKKAFGDIGEAQSLFRDARENGIIFLDEGTHHFTLRNGASLTVYASPYTPSLGDWGFQFNPKDSHNFAIDRGVDVAITHGPPRGVLDMTSSRQRAGCEALFSAIAASRPRLHCFGHIHEGWGARLVTWRDGTLSEKPSHFSNIDNERSCTIETLSSLYPRKFDTAETIAEKNMKRQQYISNGFCRTSHCKGDDGAVQPGLQTLFVNAAIQGLDEDAMQLPWIVDIELPKSDVLGEKGEGGI
ncbi:Metallophosphoesterase domain-containing protein 1 [Metarhizium anisopliae]|nr:Metallophosphoesterase domain-containing protein 1 [Metarhizium anisopliae]